MTKSKLRAAPVGAPVWLFYKVLRMKLNLSS